MEMEVLPCLSADSLAFTFTAQHDNKSLSQGCVTPISLRGATSTNKSNSKHKCETDSTRKKRSKDYTWVFLHTVPQSPDQNILIFVSEKYKKNKIK